MGGWTSSCFKDGYERVVGRGACCRPPAIDIEEGGYIDPAGVSGCETPAGYDPGYIELGGGGAPAEG